MLSTNNFTDRHGTRYQLEPDHRSALRPNWREILRQRNRLPTDKALIERIDERLRRVRLGMQLLSILGGGIRGLRVLNIGCGYGEEALSLRALGAAAVVGTNYSDPKSLDYLTTEGLQRVAHFVRQRLNHPEPVETLLAEVSIACDDIAQSRQPDSAFDLLCSWQTLEHVEDLHAALRQMKRVLKPGAYMYHEYNPFFAVDGGHSMCTLDMPWGHVRLCAEDFERYLEEMRPEEQVTAIEFYRHGLNRCTISDIENALNECGFQEVQMVPRSRTEDVLLLDQNILEQARENYPGVTVLDLSCCVVRLVARRP